MNMLTARKMSKPNRKMVKERRDAASLFQVKAAEWWRMWNRNASRRG